MARSSSHAAEPGFAGDICCRLAVGMRVHLLFFAALRDAVGFAESELELAPDDATVAGLATRLPDRFPALDGRMGSVRLAVNEEFAEPGHVLHDGDVVALIPPVSGG